MLQVFHLTKIGIITIILVSLSISVTANTNPKVVVLTSGITPQLKVITSSLSLNSQILQINILKSTKDQVHKQLSISDNVLVVGKQALEYYLANQIDKPSLVIFVKRSTYFHLTKAYTHINLVNGSPIFQNRMSVIYSDPDIFDQLSLVKKYYPSQSAALILSPLNEFLRQPLQQIALQLDIKLSILSVESDVDINRAINTLPNSYALLALPDPIIYNRFTLKNIVISSYRSNRPIFGYSKNMVKAGAVASYYIDTRDLMLHVKELIPILNKMQTPYRGYSKYKKISVNDAVARSLNLNSLKS